MIHCVFLSFLIFVSSIALADNMSDAKNFANSQLDNLANIAKTTQEQELKKNYEDFSKTDDANAKQNINAYINGNVPIEKINLDQAKEKTFSDNNNGAVKLVKDTESTRQKDDFKFSEEKWFQASENISKQPEASIKAECQDSQLKIGQEIDEYRLVERELFCREAVEATYQCNRKLHMSCNSIKECDLGGIKAGSVESDMKFSYEFPIITIGTIADNYWKGSCSVFERKTSFDIENVKDFKEFKLVEVGFDDYLLIKINNKLIYVGPDGGDRLEVKSGSVFNGKTKQACERAINRNEKLAIDLRPYLLEGKNEIYTKTIVTGAGEGWLKIKLSQHCCANWQEKWQDDCEKLRR